MIHHKAIPCGCHYAKCPDWHVSPVAMMQGTHFTREQAEAIAEILNVGDAKLLSDYSASYRRRQRRAERRADRRDES